MNNFGQLFNLTPKEVMQLFNTLMYDQRMAMGKIANGFYQRSPEIPFLEETTEPAMESAEISPNIQSEVEPNTEVPIEEAPIIVSETPISSDTPMTPEIPSSNPQKIHSFHPDSLEIKSRWGFEYKGDKIHIKIVIENPFAMSISDVRVILDLPAPFITENPFQYIGQIGPNNSRGIDFSITPKECGTFTCGRTVIWKDSTWQTHYHSLQPKPIQVKCPLMKPQQISLVELKRMATQLPGQTQSFAYTEFAPEDLFRLAQHALDQFAGFALPASSTEQWWSAQDIHQIPIIIKMELSQKSESPIIEVCVWCADSGAGTGIFTRIAENLHQAALQQHRILAVHHDREADLWDGSRYLLTALDHCLLGDDTPRVRESLQQARNKLALLLDSRTPVLGEIDHWLTEMESRIKPMKEPQLSLFQDAVGRWQTEIPQILRRKTPSNPSKVIPPTAASPKGQISEVRSFGTEAIIYSQLETQINDLSEAEKKNLSQFISQFEIPFSFISPIHALYTSTKTAAQSTDLRPLLIQGLACFYYGRLVGNPITFTDLYEAIIQSHPNSNESLETFLPENLKSRYLQFCEIANVEVHPTSYLTFARRLAMVFPPADQTKVRTEIEANSELLNDQISPDIDPVNYAIAYVLAICYFEEIPTPLAQKYQYNSEIIALEEMIIQILYQGKQKTPPAEARQDYPKLFNRRNQPDGSYQ